MIINRNMLILFLNQTLAKGDLTLIRTFLFDIGLTNSELTALITKYLKKDNFGGSLIQHLCLKNIYKQKLFEAQKKFIITYNHDNSKNSSRQ